MKYLHELGKKSREAFSNNIDTKIKNKVLNNFIILINKRRSSIINQNKKDIKNAKKKGLRENLINRLVIDSNKIDQIISSIKLITKLKDPVNKTLDSWRRPNGLIINKTTIPIGVIAVIYESRPNVTSDVSSLCFKSGNCVILKGGSEAYFTNKILVDLFRKSLRKCNVNENFVQFVNVKNRKVVDFMLSKMEKYLDVVIPRGGKGLVKRVQKLSKVSVIGHLEGICHTYIDQDASLDMAVKIVKNAKLRNTAICGATETILFHKKIIKKMINPILKNLEYHGCKIIGDNETRKFYKGNILKANDKDWSKEYLSAIVSVKTVKDHNEAVKHINKYGTMHTDCIITQNNMTAKKFLTNIKSSIAMHNTSTQFADGGEFGFGGEVGISTSTLPPRGPVGLNQLVSYKYLVSSNGKIRK